MQVRSITVSSQRKMPHPALDFANISALISISADLAEGDNVAVCVQKLQTQADNLVEKHAETIGERMRAKASSAKAASATANKADELAAKHAGTR